MFVYVIQSNFCLYSILVFCSISTMRMGYVTTSTLRHCYVCVCINMFVGVIYIVAAICLCTSYDMLHSCATSW